MQKISQIDKYERIRDMRDLNFTFVKIGKILGMSAQHAGFMYNSPKPKEKDLTMVIPKSFSGRERTREYVRRRDNYTCQMCNKKWNEKFRRFDVHHLNGFCGKKSRSYDKMSEIDGLITLCHRCHFNHPEHTIKRKKSISR
jgi:hypothetical protein